MAEMGIEGIFLFQQGGQLLEHVWVKHESERTTEEVWTEVTSTLWTGTKHRIMYGSEEDSDNVC